MTLGSNRRARLNKSAMIEDMSHAASEFAGLLALTPGIVRAVNIRWAWTAVSDELHSMGIHKTRNRRPRQHRRVDPAARAPCLGVWGSGCVAG